MDGTAGTGKTLVARALAATASKAGTKVSFFMRKGADVLSKWVGEAERQLRLLFEEAQKAQPAIIFFDEIDGLAPVSVVPDRVTLSLTSCTACLHLWIIGLCYCFHWRWGFFGFVSFTILKSGVWRQMWPIGLTFDW